MGGRVEGRGESVLVSSFVPSISHLIEKTWERGKMREPGNEVGLPGYN